MARTCNGYGTLLCHCGGDLCVCGRDGEECPGCPDCEAVEREAEDEEEQRWQEAERECGKVCKGQCSKVGTTYCDFRCPYDWRV